MIEFMMVGGKFLLLFIVILVGVAFSGLTFMMSLSSHREGKALKRAGIGLIITFVCALFTHQWLYN